LHRERLFTPLLLLTTLVLGLNIGTASWNPAAEVDNGEIILSMPAAGPGSGPCAQCQMVSRMLIASLISLDGGQYTALAMAGLACQLTSSRHATAHHGAYSLTIPYLSLSLSPQVGRLATDVLAALPETAQLITRPAKLLELTPLQALRDGGLLDLNTGLAFAKSLVRP
jgi:hypothetical protein